MTCISTNNDRLEPENNFLDLPLNTLLDIKLAWQAHPLTCIKVSSADLIQFAGFFVTIRQKDTPESLTSGSVSANAKRMTLKNDFVWGRPDEVNCDVAWTDNLPEFITPSTVGGTIPARCTGAGGEIKSKMMDRNGFTAGEKRCCWITLLLLLTTLFVQCEIGNCVLSRTRSQSFLFFMLTAEEATALIGAHSIGSTRHIFGASMSGSVSSNVHLVLVTSPQQAWSSLHPTSFVTSSQLQWVTSGADYATPCECLFLCFFAEMFVKTVSTTFFSQSFLVNQLSTSSSYSQSVPSLVMHFMTSWVTGLSRMMLSPSPPILNHSIGTFSPGSESTQLEILPSPLIIWTQISPLHSHPWICQCILILMGLQVTLPAIILYSWQRSSRHCRRWVNLVWMSQDCFLPLHVSVAQELFLEVRSCSTTTSMSKSWTFIWANTNILTAW